MPVSSDLIKQLNKKYTDKVWRVLSDTEHEKVDVISTGSLGIDYASGVGGIARGRITEIFGPESTGKSTLCQYLISNAQMQGLNVGYVDTEQSFDVAYAQVCGVNPNDLVFCQPDSLDSALLFTEDLIDSKEFGLIIFDSLVGISPAKELEDELTDTNVSLISRLITKFCRRNIYSIRDNNLALVFTNQVRDKIGAYVPMLDTTGGHALKHFAGMRIQTSRTKDIKIKAEGGEDEVIGVEFKAQFKKNKVAAPFGISPFSIYFGKGIWRAEDILTNCLNYGILKMRGSYVTFNGDVVAQGKVAAMATLDENKELCDQLTSQLLSQFDTKGQETNVAQGND